MQTDEEIFDFTRLNHQVEKTQTAGKLLNYYGDLIQRIELAIKNDSGIKTIPKKVADIPIFDTLVSNKKYSNVFNAKLNNIHKLAEEFEKGLVYIEKLTMSNRSKWLRKHFKSELEMFKPTYKEIVVKSYFDMRDNNTPIKYDIIFNFNGVNPNNQGKFNEINQLSKYITDKSGLNDALQGFINSVNDKDIQILTKGQLLDLIEEVIKK